MWIATLTMTCVFIAVCLLGARRLWALHRRSGELPELLIAVVMVGIGGAGVGASVLIDQLVPAGPVETILSFGPLAGVHLGVWALGVFNWQVYRPESAWARGGVGVLSVAMVVLFGVAVALGTGRGLVLSPRFHLVSTVCYAAPMVWSAVEALRYWSAMRRRQRIGLADALTTDRFWLWGLATGSAAVGTILGAVGQRMMVSSHGSVPVSVAACYAIFGVASAMGFWLAFVPPAWYCQWVSSRGTGGERAFAP